jgi:hypothetical protein
VPDTKIIRQVEMQPWAAVAGFGFLVHFVWEMWQAPMYRTMVEASHVAAVRVCTFATLGDAVIQVLAFGAAAIAAGSRTWLARPSRGPMTVYLIAGLLITAALEWVNVHVLQRWTYADHMPVVLGIGVAPLLQWLVVPPIVLWLAKRHLGFRTDTFS